MDEPDSPHGPAPLFQRNTLIEQALPGLTAGFSTALPRARDAWLSRHVGTLLNQSMGNSTQENSVVPKTLVLLQQTHSSRLLELPANGNNPFSGSNARDADGSLTTTRQGGWLAVKTADCVPLLAADPERSSYAALHVGWRGAVGGILPGLLRRWREAGSTLHKTVLALGPFIGVCCYEVREDCLAHFESGDLDGAVHTRNGRHHLNLAGVLENQAARFGIPPIRMDVAEQCTRCHTNSEGHHPFASYRRCLAEGSEFAHTNVGVIGAAAPGED